MRSSNKADPEGPLDRPRDVRPKVKLNKNRIDARIDPRFPVNTGGLASIGKKHALKKYDLFALKILVAFEGITGSNITPVVQFDEIFVFKNSE